MQVIRAQQKAEACWAATQKAERIWRAAVEERTPEAWRAAIDQITDLNLRIKVACLVWWDFFADRPAESRWPHLDDLIKEYKPETQLKPAALAAAMRKVGYLRRSIERRLSEDIE